MLVVKLEIGINWLPAFMSAVVNHYLILFSPCISYISKTKTN
jgi:hypothetical protein